MKPNATHCAAGFTLLELLIAMAIAGILVGVALPNFQDYTANVRTRSEAENFMSSLAYARSEAVTRNSRVSICNSSSGTGCGGTWSDGWIVFSDAGTAGTIDGTDEVLRAFAGRPGVTVTMAANFSSYISYLATGVSQGNGGAAAGVISLCGDGSRDHTVTLSITGRPTLGAASC